jgi:predicted NBD/HSP70 family sugar kinase
MIIAIDIGGTKTLVALVSQDGRVLKKIKFISPKNYQEYIKILIENINSIAKEPISVISIGCAGKIDREQGVIKISPNLGWVDVPLVPDLSQHFKNVSVIIENDANLAGLSEAHGLKNMDQKVMYITFSTGIGTGFIVNGELDANLLDSEGGHMVFEHGNKMMDWESFAAGRTIVKDYGKRASELDDLAAWAKIVKNMAIGIVDNCAVFMPDIVIIGGGVGTYFDKFKKPLRDAVNKLIKESIMIKNPVIVGAKYAEEAVILGCVIKAKQYEQR